MLVMRLNCLIKGQKIEKKNIGGRGLEVTEEKEETIRNLKV